MLDRQQLARAVQECLQSYSSSHNSTEAALNTANSVSGRQSFTEAETSDIIRELRRRIQGLEDSAPGKWANEAPAPGNFLLSRDQSPPLSPQALKRAFIASDINAVAGVRRRTR